MCEEFDQNRRTLAQLIFSTTGEFTERDMIQKYKKKTGYLVVDGKSSVTRFVRDLRELGALSQHAGRYRVKQH